MIERDWLDHEFIAEHTDRLRTGRGVLPPMDAAPDGRRHRRAARGRLNRPPRCGARRGRVFSSMRAASNIIPTACRTRSAPSTSCSPRAGSAVPRAATAPSSARPTARAVGSTARNAISCQAGATSATPSTGGTSPRCGGSTSARCPVLASMPTSCSGRSTRARSRACSRSASTRRCRCRTIAFVTRCLEKLEFFVAIDFFLNDTARHADIVLPGSLHEEDEGTVTQVEGRIIKVNKAVECPGEAREDWRIIQDIAAALGPSAWLHLRQSSRDLRGAPRRPARVASPTTRA